MTMNRVASPDASAEAERLLERKEIGKLATWGKKQADAIREALATEGG